MDGTSGEGTPAGEVFYVAQIGESNVGITQSMDWQLRHLEDRVEQTEGMIRNLEARLASIIEEVEHPWAHAREYGRLRRAYGEMGAQLQADGVAIEANTTFTADGEDDPVDNEVVAAETATAASDETTSRQNPYTGLEEWGIVVEEISSDEAEEFAGEQRGVTANLFDFVVGDTHASATADEGEFDIFLSSAGDANEEAASLNETVEANGCHQENDNDQESSVSDIFGEPSADERVVVAAVTTTLAPKRTKKQRGTAAAASKASNQSSFLFG